MKNGGKNVSNSDKNCTCLGYPEAGLLNKSSRLAPALGVTKFTIDIDIILDTLCCAT